MISGGIGGPIETIGALQARYAADQIDWETILAVHYRAALRQPRTIVDVGAHVGRHLDQFLSTDAHRVVAFEPLPKLAVYLAEKFGADQRLDIRQLALGAVPGRSDFYFDSEQPGESGMRVRSDHPDPSSLHGLRVDVATLDESDIADIDYLKIDVEGAELQVLQGAEQAVADNRPLISVEYGWQAYGSYGLDKEALLGWAVGHEYLVCNLLGEVLSGADYSDCVDRYYWDYLLVPSENRRLKAVVALTGRAVLNSIDRYLIAQA